MSQIILSRVAERVYWMARYLERIENTARLVMVYTDLLMDLPRGVNLSWYNLVVLNSATEEYLERYTVRDERNVVKFMLADETNSGSIQSTLKMVRENARTSRDVVPEATWEYVNELHLEVSENMQQGINRGTRHEFLEGIIKACHQLSGLMANSMSKDVSSEFLRLGRTLERADMVTRILDAGASVGMGKESHAGNVPQVVWGNVLHSVDAYQPYLRTIRGPVTGQGVAEFLLEDEQFPRSVKFCLNRAEGAINRLPRGDKVKRQLQEVKKSLNSHGGYAKLDQEFRDHLNSIQVKLGTLHDRFSESWFAIE